MTEATAQETTSANPANPLAKRVTEATRIPMSLPQLKLAVPEIPGYFLYWHLGKNVPRALKAGYEFVQEDEVEVNNTDLAGDAGASGNKDMGSRVSVFAGGMEDGTMEPQRLHLMKLRQDWRDADMAALEERNESIARALRGGQTPDGQQAPPGETPEDRLRKYMKKGQDLFFPKRQGQRR